MAVTVGRRIGWALGLFALWTLATWWFEGRIETFARPGAVIDRLVYSGVANGLIGVVAAGALLRFLSRSDPEIRAVAGFASRRRTALWVPLGIALGLGVYFGQGAPSSDPVVLLNAYAQVFVVSMAEVMVCWSVVATIVSRGIGAHGWLAIPLAAITASILFGVYHFAHSAPFNTIGMVGFLSVIGLLTSAIFFLSRDIYGTILFHNFLGTFGVVQALAAQDKLESFRSIQVPLISTATAALLLLILTDLLIVRRASH